MGRWIVLLLVLLISFGVGYSYGVNPDVVPISSSDIPGSIIQRPTDKPKDKPIKVNVSSGGTFCYGPNFSGGESYIVIEQCWQMHVMNARYDVFQRISYNINDTWLCITVSESVVKGETNWDYVHLRPCTINDPLQRWIVKENSFWTADERYRLKDTNWYAYISRNSGDRYNHTLDSSMSDWINTVATPGNISILTSIAWDLGSDRYFIRSGGSDKNTTPIYYNPESGHLAQYNPVSGLLSCMYSRVGSYDWNWVTWALCSDAPISKDNPAYWNVYLATEEGGMIMDYQGNALRVTRYGPNWGVAYAAKLSYLKKDTTYNPTSLFIVDRNLLNWVRYTVSNLGKTDQYCPAGKKENHNIRIKRTLPPDFQLTEEWLRRLYDIAISTSFTSEGQVHGICGTCLLQTFQMLAELQEYHSHGPIQGGGYFFNTAHDRDPFDSFRQRYPELDAMLVNIPIVYSQDGNVPRMGLASARTMLPQYDWTLSREFTTRSEMLSHITSLIASPPGSMWLSMFRVRRPDGTTGGHAVPILRTSQGLVVIPTNSASLSFFTYRRFATPTTDPVQVMNNLEMSSWTLEILVTAQLEGLYYNTFDFTISNRNCTGEGRDRRGSGGYPTRTTVNQCSGRGGGRCVLL
ncbi:hypothetical protein LIH_15410 [Leptospira interrogans serovar Hardjo-prajitno]|uniref:DUF1561 domain-containing protein n=1 Tax=Leptospira interrogans TaxID=173 RepID=UPI0007219EA0|nr:DUF1561 domain-containing protein [Leptospira interrogans]ALO01733.1 hypothetical protein LIH_15410 [Leptospira interrogans serovar Hardjo-prajitno]QEI01162.1 DUF1561 domain-containing protein [Leptospira interrogans serovar Hardjo]